MVFVSLGTIRSCLGCSLHSSKWIRDGLSLLQNGFDGIVVLAYRWQIRNGFDLGNESFATSALVWKAKNGCGEKDAAEKIRSFLWADGGGKSTTRIYVCMYAGSSSVRFSGPLSLRHFRLRTQ